MSKQGRRALEALKTSIRQNRGRVERKLRRSGIKPDIAVVYSAAKYYSALKRLANE